MPDPLPPAPPSLAGLQQLIGPLFPGLMGVCLVEADARHIVATLHVRPELCTSGAILHGGAVMAFADTLGAIGAYLNLPVGKRTTTIESSTKFIGAAKVGSEVTGTTTPFHIGRSASVWQTQITSDQGRLCAVVTQTQLVLDA